MRIIASTILFLTVLSSCNHLRDIELYQKQVQKVDPLESFVYKDIFTDSKKTKLWGVKTNNCKDKTQRFGTERVSSSCFCLRISIYINIKLSIYLCQGVRVGRVNARGARGHHCGGARICSLGPCLICQKTN